MRDITIAAPYVEQAIAGARHAGYDTNRLLSECGITVGLRSKSRARVSLDAFVLLHQRAMRLMNDEVLGLYEKPQRVGSFALITRSLLPCQSVGDALTLHARSSNVFENGFHHSFHVGATRAQYRLHRRSPDSVRNLYAVEYLALTLHRFMAWLCQRRIPLTQVRLDYPPPTWVDEYRYLFYGAPVAFNQHEITLEFDTADMNAPLQRDSASLDAYIARAPRDLFTPSMTTTISERVRREIIKKLQHSSELASMREVARQLDLHPQTLRRRLHAEETDYTEIRTLVRRDAAIYLLSQKHLKVAEIANALDFSESSAFTRAFKEWMGMTPLEYRTL